jgi:hypothetical protein
VAEQLIRIPWSRKLQQVATALAQEPEQQRNANPVHLVARQLLVLLKLGEIVPFERALWYVQHNEPAAASGFSDAELRQALNSVIDVLASRNPMNLMQL